MSAWILAVVLCVSVSAQVVETARVAAPSVPGAAGAAGAAATIPQSSLLAPSLGLGATLALPQTLVRFAPPAAAERSAAVEAASRAEEAPGRAPARKDSVPPSLLKAGRAVPAAASFQGRRSVGPIPKSASVRSETGGRVVARTVPAAGVLQKVPIEGAAAVGRRVWDQSSEHASLEAVSPVPVVPTAAPASAPGSAFASVSGARSGRPGAFRDQVFVKEALHDAVASPAAFSAGSFLLRPGAPALPPSPRQAPSTDMEARSIKMTPAAPLPATSLDRLSLELASGLVVKVRAALGLLPAPATFPAGLPRAAASPRAVPATGAPLTSTEWLERRGLLETLSAAESAAGDASAAPRFARSGRDASAASSAPARPVPNAPAAPALPASAFWGLALLPAVFVLLRKFL